MPAGEHQRVVVQRDQTVQAGVGPPQQRAQVVVLAEERVEAPAHGHRLVAVLHRPGAHPAAELGLGLDHGDGDAPLGQPDGGGEPGDPAAGDQHRGLAGAASATGRRRVPDRTRVPTRPPARPSGAHQASGFRARNVCRMPRCQPGAVRTSTSRNPAR